MAFEKKKNIIKIPAARNLCVHLWAVFHGAVIASFLSHCGARSCVGVGANEGADGHLSASLPREKQTCKNRGEDWKKKE